MAVDVSSEDSFPRSRIGVLDAEMAYVDVGQGEPGSGAIVFLHGNPTSSYLWRNVLPRVQHLGRCLAPDLIGMGDSAKLPDPGPGTYSLDTHIRYLEAFLEAVELNGPVIFVLHDWGSALGFDWASRHPDRVRGIAFMEAIVNPLTWADWPEASRRIFRGMRGADGEEMVLDKNVFVERILPGSVRTGLTPEARERYRRPFASREDRWPTLEWPRQLPIENVPPRSHDIVDSYGRYLRTSDVPKLFIDAQPGSILIGRMRALVRKWPGLTEVTVPAGHFVPEDAPHDVGNALAKWIPTLR